MSVPPDKLIQKQQGQLYKMSVKITSNLIPACDSCRLLNTWGKLQVIKDSSLLFKDLVIANPSQKKIDNSTLANLMKNYMAIDSLARLSPGYPSNDGLGDTKKKNKACRKELRKHGTHKFDRNKCYRPYLEDTVLVHYARKILAELSGPDRKSDKKMKDLPKVDCLPGSNYKYINFAPR